MNVGRQDSVWSQLGLAFDRLFSRVVYSSIHTAAEASARWETAPAAHPAPPAAPEPPTPAPEVPPLPEGVPEYPPGWPTSIQELTEMDDDDLKLVAYSIVSARRGYERFVTAGSEVVSGRMSVESFVSWMIAKNAGELEPAERKYLRVHYTVVRRWPREPLDFEENQLKSLDGIRRALEEGNHDC